MYENKAKESDVKGNKERKKTTFVSMLELLF